MKLLFNNNDKICPYEHDMTERYYSETVKPIAQFFVTASYTPIPVYFQNKTLIKRGYYLYLHEETK